MLLDGFASKRVLLTGHTGFKGSWLAEWLLLLGAEVTGYALPPPTQPSLFEQLGLQHRLRHTLGDVRDLASLSRVVAEVKPEFIFHLAAQPLVRHSYAQPVETYTTNVIGTVNLLEAVRSSQIACTVIIATTDKCYENHEGDHLYAETEALGGHDPYSSSKACAELVVSAYRRSFFEKSADRVAVATARAGNVLGGGDWAADRILPDSVRDLGAGRPIRVRNPRAIRPWQHVLESLSGYLVLASSLAAATEASDVGRISALSSAFNFGPDLASHRPVQEVVEEALKHWPGTWIDQSSGAAPHEAGRLQLSVTKAANLLGWRPVWGLAPTVEQTLRWYRETASLAASSATGAPANSVAAFTRQQIRSYLCAAKAAGLPWAV